MPVQIQLRHDTAANWTSANPTLALGEVGIETDTDFFKFGDGSTAWTGLAYAGGGSFTNPMTTAGDIIVGDTGGAPLRLAKGSDAQVLTIDSGTHLPVWDASASGFTNPMTTKGDVILGDTGGTATRLAAGTSTFVLTSNGAGNFPSWQAGGGGGGGLSLPTVIQFSNATNGVIVTMGGTPANGSRLILCSSTNAGAATGTTAVSSMNTTWTHTGTFTNVNGGIADIWTGVCAASAGTVITAVNTATFVQIAVAEVADALTPTLAASQGSSVSTIIGFNGDSATTPLVPAGAGDFLVLWVANDNAGTQPAVLFNIPVTFVCHQTGADLYLGYTPTGGNVVGFNNNSNSGSVLLAEIT